MLSLLRTKRWLSFTAIVVIVIIAFGFLSRWQWSRAAEKRVLNSSMVAAMAAEPVKPALVAGEWTPVRATGRYDSTHEVVVRKRPQGTVNGFWVMTPLTTGEGTLWVNRGWLRAVGNAVTYPEVPAAPTGEVEVTGIWRSWQVARTTSGLPAGMVSDADPAVFPVSTEFPGFVQLTESMPAQNGLEAVLLPEIDDSTNISYAVQWILFAFVCIAGWWIFLRREAREDSTPATVEE
jgi:cytochrome oxidase assembly protein ShyY1